MTTEHVAAWLLKQSDIPKKALKPLATRLGLPANHVGAALFAGQIVYENQDTIVEYASKGGVTVGEFLHERARDRYGEDHPLTRHLGENVEAISEAFEGTEEEARTFAEFYRQYREVDREHRLRDGIDLDVPESLRERLPDRDSIPDRNAIPGRDSMPGRDAIPGKEALSNLRGDSDADDAEEVVDIPVTDSK